MIFGDFSRWGKFHRALVHVCLNYKELNSPTRRSTNAKSGHCDKRNARKRKRDWKGPGWYRITGEAGTKLVDSEVEDKHCGTHATGWMDGGHPTVAEGEVNRTVNFNYVGNNAWNSRNIKVVNCNTHYVYYLIGGTCSLG